MMEVIFRFGDREWSYDFDTTIPAVGDKVQLWFMDKGFPWFVWAVVQRRDWHLSPGSEQDGHEPYVVMCVEPFDLIPDGAIEDSEVWPASDEARDDEQEAAQ